MSNVRENLRKPCPTWHKWPIQQIKQTHWSIYLLSPSISKKKKTDVDYSHFKIAVNKNILMDDNNINGTYNFYAPAIKWQGAYSVCFVRHSVASKFVFSTPPTSLHGFEWNLVQMLYRKSRSACGEIIHVRQILAELWSLTLRIFTHFSLFSQLLLHPCIDLNETWQGCCSTSLKVHVGR